LEAYVNRSNRLAAFLSYLLGVLGWLYMLAFRRKDTLARYHAKQSLGITIVAVGAPAVWAVAAWIVTWIPLVGPLVAAASFSLVIATYALLTVCWVVGMVYALQAKIEPIPVVGRWAERIPV
jgi:uncharacterized membrane protein